MGGIYIVAITAIVFGFVYSIVKMGIDHDEKLKRMKHGYPLKDGTAKTENHSDIIDYRDNFGNGQNNNNQ